MTFSEPASQNWQKNLYAIFIAELLVMAGFSFVSLLCPYTLKSLAIIAIHRQRFGPGSPKVFVVLPCFYPRRCGDCSRTARAENRWCCGLSSAARLWWRSLHLPNVPFLVIMRFFQGAPAVRSPRLLPWWRPRLPGKKAFCHGATDDGNLYRQQFAGR